jgi:hypothetical protein
LDVRLIPGGGERILDGRGIVSFDDAGTNHRDRHETEAQRQELAVRGVVIVDAFHGKVCTFL